MGRKKKKKIAIANWILNFHMKDKLAHGGKQGITVIFQAASHGIKTLPITHPGSLSGQRAPIQISLIQRNTIKFMVKSKIIVKSVGVIANELSMNKISNFN